MSRVAKELFAVIREAGLDYRQFGDLMQRIGGTPTDADVQELTRMLLRADRNAPIDRSTGE